MMVVRSSRSATQAKLRLARPAECGMVVCRSRVPVALVLVESRHALVRPKLVGVSSDPSVRGIDGLVVLAVAVLRIDEAFVDAGEDALCCLVSPDWVLRASCTP